MIELDGGQHLANADAYRRDRRKDALLQEHGYFVLRFLAEDVGKRLDLVLDAILAHGRIVECRRLSRRADFADISPQAKTPERSDRCQFEFADVS